MTRATTLSINNATKGTMPAVAFVAIKNAVLGARYELSLAFVTPKEAKRITLAAKGIDKASNVLSFPLSPTSGEIIICLATARREAPDFNATFTDFVTYLFIHGMFHLKGQDHGAIMEINEQRILRKFGAKVDF